MGKFAASCTAASETGGGPVGLTLAALLARHGIASRVIEALCQSLAPVGESKAQLFLSMVCLSLMACCDHAEDVLPLIANVQAQCAAEAGAET